MADNNDDHVSAIGRIGALGSGFGFLLLGAVDAVLDPFPSPETGFFTVGVALVALRGDRKETESEVSSWS